MRIVAAVCGAATVWVFWTVVFAVFCPTVTLDGVPEVGVDVVERIFFFQ